MGTVRSKTQAGKGGQPPSGRGRLMAVFHKSINRGKSGRPPQESRTRFSDERESDQANNSGPSPAFGLRPSESAGKAERIRSTRRAERERSAESERNARSNGRSYRIRSSTFPSGLSGKLAAASARAGFSGHVRLVAIPMADTS